MNASPKRRAAAAWPAKRSFQLPAAAPGPALVPAVLAVLLLPAGGLGQHATGAAPPVEPNDYADEDAWLCLPGRDDACATDHRTTVIEADGSFREKIWSPDPDAPVDCFYVYPTVSTDPGRHADMNPGEAEANVIRRQFARFASKCRPFAPVYRQVTITALRAGEDVPLGTGLGYDDVLDAWTHYLERHSEGRGFVLVGHSQGAAVLTELVRREIDGRPIQSRLVGAFLVGSTVPVAVGGDVGGAFEHVPVCRSASQAGCVISYGTFRATSPPPANTLFGRVDEPGLEAICTNPAALEGGAGDLHAYLSTDRRAFFGTTPIPGTAPPGPWVTPERPVETPWVSVPGLLTAHCASNAHANYLEITVHGEPDDARTDDVTGDVPGCLQCGLHLVDMELAMGNLLEILDRQTRAWLAARGGG